MKNNGDHSNYNQTNKNEDEELWNKFKIDFHREAPEFPDNKIYATIYIKPESARKLIDKFILIVNNSQRYEFDKKYDHISASGFYIPKKNYHIPIKIQAIPCNKTWKTIKESKPCTFSFSGEIFNICPIINFNWDENNSKPDVVVKWSHIGDRWAQKYIVYLDNKEIYYINQLAIRDEIEIYIHDLDLNKKYTIEIEAKLNNGKGKYRSDPMNFIVPEENNQQNAEVISIANESVPPRLLGIIDTNNNNEQSSREHDEFKERALILLRLLTEQIEKKKKES